MMPATPTVETWELRHRDVQQAFLKANIDEEIHIDLSEDYQKFPGAVRTLNKSIYGLNQVERCWNLKLTNDIKKLGFE